MSSNYPYRIIVSTDKFLVLSVNIVFTIHIIIAKLQFFSEKILKEGKKLKHNVSFLAFLSFIRTLGFARSYWHSEMKRKACFPFAFLSFIRTLGFARSYSHSEIKMKTTVFILYFSRLFVTLHSLME